MHPLEIVKQEIELTQTAAVEAVYGLVGVLLFLQLLYPLLQHLCQCL